MKRLVMPRVSSTSILKRLVDYNDECVGMGVHVYRYM